MHRTLIVILFVLLSCAVCFGQSSFKGLTPGKATRSDVERMLGQPVNKLSETLYEYAPPEVKTYHQISCGQIFVQYRKQSRVVERIEVLCDSNNCLEMLVHPFEATFS